MFCLRWSKQATTKFYLFLVCLNLQRKWGGIIKSEKDWKNASSFLLKRRSFFCCREALTNGRKITSGHRTRRFRSRSLKSIILSMKRLSWFVIHCQIYTISKKIWEIFLNLKRTTDCRPIKTHSKSNESRSLKPRKCQINSPVQKAIACQV